MTTAERRDEEGVERPVDEVVMVAGGADEAAGRLSVLNPMNLGELFAQDPELAKKRGEGGKVPRSLLFAGSRLDDEFELRKLQVFVRIRPSATQGAPRPPDAALMENCIHATSRHSIAIAPPEGSQAYKSGDRGQTYSFTRVFDADTGQQDYYEATAAPLVHDLLRNPKHSSLMLAYGITAAGKTFTIEGTRSQPGVMLRALGDLFAGLASHAEPITVRVSFYEVYNEQIYDLLDETGVGSLGQRPALRLKEDSHGRVFVAGLLEVEVGSTEEALGALRRGSRLRQRGETGLNYSSSRSHSIFTLILSCRSGAGGGGMGRAGAAGQLEKDGEEEEEEEGEGGRAEEERLGRLSFVDLAGSERAQRTGNVGVRLKESVAINSSLMTLGRCLEALRWNQQHRDKGPAALRVVPYRQSKVTHLFRDALHGWGQVLLSVNVSPVARDYDETAHVLKYAALATQIGTIQQVEAPRRTIKAVSPDIKKVKRKAALPPEARRQTKVKRNKAGAGGAAAAAGDGEELDQVPPRDEDHHSHGAQGRANEEVFHTEVGETGPSSSCKKAACSRAPALAAGSPAASGGVDEGEQVNCELLAAMGAEHGTAEAEYEGTPLTPVGLGEGEEDEDVGQLQAQVHGLLADLQKAEERCVLVEAEVRQEVAEEMAQLLRDMEANYRHRLEAEVASLEAKLGGGGGGGGAAEGGTWHGKKGSRGKAAKEGEGGQAGLEAARAAAAEAEGRAAQLQGEAGQICAELAAAQAQAAELEEQVEQARQRLEKEEAEAESLRAELAAAQAHTVAAIAEAGAQQAAAQALSAELAVERQARQQREADLAAEVATERQRAAGLEGQLAAALQRVGEVEGGLAAAQQQAGELGGELESARQQAAALAAKLQGVVVAAQGAQWAASEEFESRLQEELTQVEANRGMEVEMLEQQLDRARKDNTALRQRLEAAMATLASLASPSKPLLQKLAQAAPAGNGRGAGGTPHDVALARARQAAAEDAAEAAAAAAATGPAAPGSAAAAAGGPSGPRPLLQSTSRAKSRFADQAAAAQAPASVSHPAHQGAPAGAEALAAGPAPASHEVGAGPVADPAGEQEAEPRTEQTSGLQHQPGSDVPAVSQQQAEGQQAAGQQDCAAKKAQPAMTASKASGRARKNKGVAFAPEAAADTAGADQAPAAEPRRTRRLTRAAAQAALPAAEAEPEQPKPTRRGRRGTQAGGMLALAPAEALESAPGVQDADVEQQKEQQQQQGVEHHAQPESTPHKEADTVQAAAAATAAGAEQQAAQVAQQETGAAEPAPGLAATCTEPGATEDAAAAKPRQGRRATVAHVAPAAEQMPVRRRAVRAGAVTSGNQLEGATEAVAHWTAPEAGHQEAVAKGPAAVATEPVQVAGVQGGSAEEAETEAPQPAGARRRGRKVVAAPPAEPEAAASPAAEPMADAAVMGPDSGVPLLESGGEPVSRALGAGQQPAAVAEAAELAVGGAAAGSQAAAAVAAKVLRQTRRSSRIPGRENREEEERTAGAAGQPRKAGRRRAGAGLTLPEPIPEEPAEGEGQEQQQGAAVAGAGERAVAPPACGAAAAPAGAAGPVAGAGAGSRKRKKLLAPTPLSAEMRSALGEWNAGAEAMALEQHVARKHQRLRGQEQEQQPPARQLGAAVGPVGPAEARPARTRRQTQFYQL